MRTHISWGSSSPRNSNTIDKLTYGTSGHTPATQFTSPYLFNSRQAQNPISTQRDFSARRKRELKLTNRNVEISEHWVHCTNLSCVTSVVDDWINTYCAPQAV